MGYQYYIEQDRPYSSFSLDTLAGARSVAPLVAGIGNAQVVGGANLATYTFPGFVNTRRGRSFALEAWFRPNIVNEPTIILGHANYDGIIYDGSKIQFVLKLASSTIAISCLPPRLTSYHVVAEYDSGSMTLYVNGVRVDGHSFTSAEAADVLISASDSSNLVSGTSASGNSRITIDAVAFYAQKVPEDMPARHYTMGQTGIQIMRILSAYGAGVYELNDSKLPSGAKAIWNSRDSWVSGLLSNIAIGSDGILRPKVGQTASWQNNLILNGVSGITGSVIEWDSAGTVTVSTSLDGGATWSVAANGYQVPGLSSGYVSTGKTLLVKVDMSGDTSYVSRIYVNVYIANSVYFTGGSATTARRIIFSNPALSTRLFYPIDFTDRGGVRSNQITIEKDLDTTPTNMQAIEFWVKPNTLGASAATIFDARSAGNTGKGYLSWNGTSIVSFGFGAVYLDGVPLVSANFTVSEWHHVIVVLTAGENFPYTMGTDFNGQNPLVGDYGMINLYSSQLVQSDVTSIYGAYFNFAGLTVNDTASISIQEPTPAYDLYGYDWTVAST